MLKSFRLALAVSSLGIVACGGGSGHSPTEPAPTPTNVPLPGTWAGTVVENNPPGMTCTVTVEIGEAPDYLGNWQAQCPDGSMGGNLSVAFPLPFAQILLGSLPSPAVFGGCGWSSTCTKDGRQLSGDWVTDDNCQTGPALQGRMDLTKQN
jgi:hypothetical protein